MRGMSPETSEFRANGCLVFEGAGGDETVHMRSQQKVFRAVRIR